MSGKFYQLFTIVQRRGQDDFWLNIGSLHLHGKDADGDPETITVLMQALPLQDSRGECRLVGRPYDPTEAKTNPKK